MISPHVDTFAKFTKRWASQLQAQRLGKDHISYKALNEMKPPFKSGGAGASDLS